MKIREGIGEEFRAQAASLYWDAFALKLDKALGPAEKGRSYFEQTLNLNRAFIAYEGDELLGLAGFDIGEGGLVQESFYKMFQIYGFSSFWRILLLSIFGRERNAQTLYIDGIVVAAAHQNQGIGSKLIQALEQKARSQSIHTISLDVINTNPRAQALYHAQGFKTKNIRKLYFLSRLYHFQSATHMIKDLQQY